MRSPDKLGSPECGDFRTDEGGDFQTNEGGDFRRLAFLELLSEPKMLNFLRLTISAMETWACVNETGRSGRTEQVTDNSDHRKVLERKDDDETTNDN